ncbi:MAG: methyltransferase domain-containing protein [bacterium]|nr:methyltransferase domain-containing protein [bacterium]
MNYLQKNKFFRNIIYKIKSKGAKDRIKKIKPYLNKNDKILDIGAGSCIVCEILQEEGYETTPIDVKNFSFAEGIKSIIYDGNKIPFKTDEFNVSLILTVLHHTPSPEKVLEEAKRTSRLIIIIEDIYTNTFNKYIAYFIDSLLNLEFIGCPHTNKNDKEWKKIFNKMNLNLLDVKYHMSPFGVKRTTYCLKK